MARRFTSASFVCLLSLILGCQAATETQISERSSGDPAAGQSFVNDETLVTLKVPNMT